MSESKSKFPLSPLPVRLLVYALLLGVALASIWLIDGRAMQRQQEFRDNPHQVGPPLLEAPRGRGG
ncbi:MAG: hypothetical protein WD009_12910 [Phycisphaeraceae bacterium]